MSQTLIPVSFANVAITIVPHTATLARHVGKPITIGEFAGERRVRMYRVEETGDWLIQCAGPHLFIEGPEARSAA